MEVDTDLIALLNLSQPLIIPALVLIGVTAMALVVRGIILRVLHRWAERTKTDLDDLVIRAVRLPSALWR